MPISVSSVIQPNEWNQGFQTRKGIKLLPIQVGPLRAIVSSLGGNILSFEVDGSHGKVQAAKTFLDFSGDSDFDLPNLKGMMEIGGLTPPMYPGVGRLTKLPNDKPISGLKKIPGYRMLTDNIGIHGAAHNKNWKVTNDGLQRNGDYWASVEFEISPYNNKDLYEVFGAGNISRSYYFKSIDDGAEVRISTAIKGICVFGDHSFFETPDRSKWTLESPASKLWEVDPNNNGVPTGELIEGGQFNSPKLLDTHFDGTFTELGSVGNNQAISKLLNTDSGLLIEVLQTRGLFPHRTIFTPLDKENRPRDFTCIEACTTSPDAYLLSELNKFSAPLGTYIENYEFGTQFIKVKFT